MAKKKVKVCKKCSGFNVTKLDEVMKEKHYKVGCIGKCSKKYPKLAGKVYGYIDGDFEVCDTKKEFLAKIAKLS